MSEEYIAASRLNNPETSRKAAGARRNPKVLEEALVKMLAWKPCHDEELVRRLRTVADDQPSFNYSDQAVRTSRKHLVDLGRVIDSGKRARTRMGREAVVWKAAA